MANEEMDTNVVTEDNTNEDTNEDTYTEEESTYSQMSAEDYEALQNRLKKAEDTIVKYKKQMKGKVEDWEVITKTDFEVTRFVDRNPEYEWKEDQIKSYLKRWLTMDEVKRIVEPNQEVANRQKTNQTTITAWEYWWDQTSYTKDELANMSQAEYNKVMDLKDAWKVVIK